MSLSPEAMRELNINFITSYFIGIDYSTFHKEDEMTIAEVKAKFLRRESAQSLSLKSTGDKLLSYGYYEIARWTNNELVLRKGPLISPTSSRHKLPLNCHELAVMADNETPENNSIMEL